MAVTVFWWAASSGVGRELGPVRPNPHRVAPGAPRVSSAPSDGSTRLPGCAGITVAADSVLLWFILKSLLRDSSVYHVIERALSVS